MLTLYINGGDWDLEEEFEQRGTAGTYVAATGLTPTGALVATKGSTTPIHASLSGSLAARSGDTNRYYLTVAGAAIAAQLASSENQIIWKYVAVGTVYQRWEPIRVKLHRT
ncbi:MAG: hypothetical protein AB7G23_19145 [Vicinamibacterales bacterium]